MTNSGPGEEFRSESAYASQAYDKDVGIRQAGDAAVFHQQALAVVPGFVFFHRFQGANLR